MSKFEDNHIIHLGFPPLYKVKNAIDKLPEDDPIRIAMDQYNK